MMKSSVQEKCINRKGAVLFLSGWPIPSQFKSHPSWISWLDASLAILVSTISFNIFAWTFWTFPS